MHFVQNPFVYTVVGIFSIVASIVGFILLSPFFLYRYLVTKVYPRPPEISRLLSPASQFISFDLLSSSEKISKHGPRAAIVAKQHYPGSLKPNQVKEAIETGLINLLNDHGIPKFPEFREYCKQWMGYMVWCKDENFSIDNHFFVHSIQKSRLKTSQIFLDDLVECLVNKQFDMSKSPWEIHFLTNYKNFETIVLLRVHHCLADGFSLLFAIVEGLMGQTVQLPPNLSELYPRRVNPIYCVWRLLHDVGYLVTESLNRDEDLALYCPDNAKKGYQRYAKSNLIPVKTVKLIKNKLGVSFTSVILAVVSSAVSKFLKTKCNVKRFPMGVPIPLPGHPKKLENHMAAGMFHLPCDPILPSLQRLEMVDKIFLDVRHNSQFPCLSRVFMIAIGSLPVFIGRRLPTNKFFSLGLTSMPGSPQALTFEGEECDCIDFCVGGIPGDCGLTLSLITYNGRFRFSALAEAAVMSEEELATFVRHLEHEIDILYTTSIASSTRKALKGKA